MYVYDKPREKPRRLTQAERRARTRHALLESAARELSRHGYGNLSLQRVASNAGYSRGALYHLFDGKEDLALAVVEWVAETWREEVGHLSGHEADPLAAMIALARGHAVYCRRGLARVLMALRVQFDDPEHAVGAALERTLNTLLERFALLIRAARRSGAIGAGPPARTLAHALVGAIEGAMIELAGRTPHDEMIAERVLLGVLALAPAASPR